MPGEPQGFFSGFVRIFQSFFDALINFFARLWDWILRCLAALGSFFLGLVTWLFEFAVTIITRLMALPAAILGVILSVVGALFGVVLAVIVQSTSLPVYVESLLRQVFNGLGINGFFYFLKYYLAFDSLLQFGLIYLGFTLVLIGFGFIFRILWGLVPKF